MSRLPGIKEKRKRRKGGGRKPLPESERRVPVSACIMPELLSHLESIYPAKSRSRQVESALKDTLLKQKTRGADTRPGPRAE